MLFSLKSIYLDVLILYVNLPVLLKVSFFSVGTSVLVQICEFYYNFYHVFYWLCILLYNSMLERYVA